MLFNSINFAIFLPVVFLLYWFATRGNYKIQNILLLVASYFFYAMLGLAVFILAYLFNFFRLLYRY